ncbi:MAG TPA: hypothetical protein VF755_15895 [Catenuloplanes sp.]
MGHATRGMSAPPEVVVNTATDPDRQTAWLPGPWRTATEQAGEDDFTVRLTGADDGAGSGVLQVRAGASGGSSVELRLDDDAAGAELGPPQQILDNLEREVVDNFNYG